MKITRFKAPSTREALRQIRESLGEDAVILSNKPIDGGVEIVAAVDYDEAAFAQHQARGRSRESMFAKPRQERSESFSQTSSETPRAFSGATQGGAERLGRQDPSPDAGVMALRQEIRELRQWVEAQIKPLPVAGREGRSERRKSAGARADSSSEVLPIATPWVGKRWQREAEMEEGDQLGLGFSSQHAQAIAKAVQQGASLEDALRTWAEDHLASRQGFFQSPGYYALVGPTGVGKTTTIAKLAARLVRRHGASSVALVSTDGYRIAGVEQLKIYGRILGVPVELARSAEELRERLAAFASRQYVLIDTVGLSPRDARLPEQLAMLDHFGTQVKRVLVLNAAASKGHQSMVLERYGRVELDACIVSKVDETITLGEALETVLDSGLPLVYCSNGQRVPEDLHAPSPEWLAKQMMIGREETRGRQAGFC